jgi:hypothetical protein
MRRSLYLFRMLILLLLLLTTPSFANEPDACSAALVEELEGTGAKLKHEDGTEEALLEEAAVAVGDTLETDASTSVDLTLCDGTEIRVGNNSTYKLESADKGNWAWELAKGYIRAKLYSDPNSDRVRFRVTTPTSTLGVRGTEFILEEKEEGGTVHTLEGEVLYGDREQAAELDRPFSQIAGRFRRVGKEQFSRVQRGRAGAQSPRKFLRKEFEKRESRFFRRAFQAKAANKPAWKERAQKALGARRVKSPSSRQEKRALPNRQQARPQIRKQIRENRQQHRQQNRQQRPRRER